MGQEGSQPFGDQDLPAVRRHRGAQTHHGCEGTVAQAGSEHHALRIEARVRRVHDEPARARFDLLHGHARHQHAAQLLKALHEGA